MLKYKPFPFSVLVLMVLIILHLVGSHFSWYWSYSGFEFIIHILGGLWSALVLLWLSSYLNQINSMKEYRTKSLLIALISAAVVGIVWELCENFGGLTSINAPGYSLNTALDILSDCFGGVLAYLYFIRRTHCLDSCSDILHPFYSRLGLHNEKI